MKRILASMLTQQCFLTPKENNDRMLGQNNKRLFTIYPTYTKYDSNYFP